MNAKTIARLYEVKGQLKDLKDEEKHLNELVLDTMLKDDASTYKTSHFTVSVGYRKSYEMPQWFLDQEEELKLSKKKAQSEASFSKTPYLSFLSRSKVEPVEHKPGQLHI